MSEGSCRPEPTGHTEEQDRQLVSRVANGDLGALDALYARYAKCAYRAARSVCRDHQDAEDALHNAFLSIWKSAATFSAERGTVAAWLLTVVRRRAIDVVRGNGRQAEGRLILSDQGAGGEDPAERVETQAEASQLRARLQRLPIPQLEVVSLAYFGELSHREIAEHLAVPEGTVKGRMRLALRRLRADGEADLRAAVDSA